jgi:hypothetical protein
MEFLSELASHSADSKLSKIRRWYDEEKCINTPCIEEKVSKSKDVSVLKHHATKKYENGSRL